MAIFLGVDTGGTYTDAVLIEDEARVIASAKALTTKGDLAVGIGHAVDAVLGDAGLSGDAISLVSLSTTLATNALVEGQGRRVALVFIGFSERDIGRQGLDETLKGDPVAVLAGGHNHAGGAVAPLNLDGLRAFLDTHGDHVSGFAVAGQFATRNPEHEVAARDLIRAITGKPVSCSHELSAKLGGPKRAMTAVLNARLIGMIDHLISASEELMISRGITAPIMVVRGDGALISADQARERPIETILSGPAASIVGARWLTGEEDALVSDIGGTTTDVAILRAGRPMIDPQGAKVGVHRTMVEAVAMRTTGLGGDSEVHLAKEGLAGGLTLGPRRVLPVSLLAVNWPELVHKALDAAVKTKKCGEMDGRFVLATVGAERAVAGLAAREQTVLEAIGTEARAMGDVLNSRLQVVALDRLVARGLVILSGVTPSDAAHVLGLSEAWDRSAAERALALFAMQRTGSGQPLAEGAEDLARRIVDRMTEQTAETLLEAAVAEEACDLGMEPAQLARHALTKAGLDGHRGVLKIDLGLNLPVVGLGASARTYYPAVGQRLNTRMVLPEHGGVANAIGAVVGQITMREQGQITSAGEGRFRVHLSGQPQEYSDEAKAVSDLEQDLGGLAMAAAERAGAEGIRLRFEHDMKRATIEGRDVFVEGTITAVASGRPRIAAE
jgi:N-methylhydantoinase A/oxoprolinase/acetone carboxylase beta subunit